MDFILASSSFSAAARFDIRPCELLLDLAAQRYWVAWLQSPRRPISNRVVICSREDHYTVEGERIVRGKHEARLGRVRHGGPDGL